MAGRIRIRISGWRYAPWRGNFYPKKLAEARDLEYASRIFSSIELNGSFYSLQLPSKMPGLRYARAEASRSGPAPQSMPPEVMDPGSSPG